MRNKTPQFLPRIKTYLMNGKVLTPRIAVSRWDCWRVAVYICRLRKLGHKIKTEIVRTKSGRQYAKYTMI